MPRLTKTYVASLSPRASTYLERDSELAGFAVRVTPAGSKSYCIEYRANGGGRRAPKRLYTIGSVATFRPEAARNAAQDLLASIRLGADPAAEKTSSRSGATISELHRMFIEEKIRPVRKPRTVELYQLYFRLHILPEFGARRAIDITHSDVVKFHRRIGVKAKPTANRVLSLLSHLFSWAIEKKKIAPRDNPARSIELFSEKSRERFLTSEELGRLGDAIREAESVGIPYEVDETRQTAKHAPKPENRFTVISPFSAAAIRLLLLTGARLREILDLRWTDVDLQRGLLFLSESKTGKKTLILNAPAMLILSTLPRIGVFVIAGQSAGGQDETARSDLSKPWRAITKRAGLEGLRLHDLRHTHASIGVGASVGLPIIGKLLGHTNPDTTQRYAHLADDPVRRASERIGSDIAAAMGEPLTGGTVVGMGRRS
jgi:integrase